MNTRREFLQGMAAGLCLPLDLAAGAQTDAPLPAKDSGTVEVTITPAAPGRQLVRVSLPLPRGFVRDGQTLEASVGNRKTYAALRALTWHPVTGAEPRSARRALVTFPYSFRDRQPVRFVFRPRAAVQRRAAFPVRVTVAGDTVTVAYKNGPTLLARLTAPGRTAAGAAQPETVESNAFYLWQRFRVPDPEWPRVIEVRADTLGGVVVVAHLQRNVLGDGRAPDFGWNIEIQGGAQAKGRPSPPGAFSRSAQKEGEHRTSSFSFEPASFKPCELFFDEGRHRIYQPAAPFQKRGRVEAGPDGEKLVYRYLRCTEAEKVPMQQAAWRRAEFCVAPTALSPVTVTLESPHEAQIDWKAWDALYDTGAPLDLAQQPELAALLRYHRQATTRTMVREGDDWGNVTGYSDGSLTGGAFGMNRLNHGLPIFEEAFRSGDRPLLETALLWCDNFYDLTIWWGPGETGGTRYNNVIAMGKTPPDDDRTFMWRSNSAVSFCTKGYAAFFLAYEQTGDPRMKEALDAQVAYVARHLHAGRNYTRNVGDVHDFLRLYRWTGERRYFDEALRLFRDLRSQLSTGDLFTESGLPITPDPPFIEDDKVGSENPFAKPYIIGYALAGLPELARLAPDEPKLRTVVRAVADFLAQSRTQFGGWRYPHPRSSYLILSQGMEHAWQLAQAGRLLGPQPEHLDAIERVLRQRLLGWSKTGKLFGGLTGWETATGKIKQASDIYALYKRPGDRDFTRDYTEGRPDYGGSSPEGLVYFPDVLAFYLKHRPASRLTAPPKPDEPLGKVLAR